MRFVTLFLLLLSAPLFAEEEAKSSPDTLGDRKIRELLGKGSRTIRLWPGEVPDEPKPLAPESTRHVDPHEVLLLDRVSEPSLTIVAPASDAKQPLPCVLVVPGGGYHVLAIDYEGARVVRWLNRLGITAAILKHRIPRRGEGFAKHHHAHQDAQRALGILRHRSKELNLDPKRLGLLGFSAGGHLVAAASNLHAARAYPRVDAADDRSCRPDFAVLVYPAYLSEPRDSDQLAPLLAPKISAETTPPSFIAIGAKDGLLRGAMRYLRALVEAKVPVEFHAYDQNAHGTGLSVYPLSRWAVDAARWFEDQGLIEPRPGPDPSELADPKTYARSALLEAGDPERGRRVFESERATCTRCHTVSTPGEPRLPRKAGPDLLGIGDKYDRKELVRSLVEPSQSILAGYAAEVVTTKSGEVLSGIVETQTDTELSLWLATGELRKIPRQDIREEKADRNSLMPSGLEQIVGLADLRHLVSYLETLKDPTVEGLATGGTPRDIPRLAKSIRFEPIHPESMRFQHPVWYERVPGTEELAVVVENDPAKVWLLEGPEGAQKKTLFVDLSKEVHQGSDMGLMGFAFHPRFPEVRKYYLDHHVLDEGKKFYSVVIEREIAADLRRDAGTPSRRLIELHQPSTVHTGGMLRFGPEDGLLYIGTGDGGPQTDPFGNAQSLSHLAGAILRIDVDRKDPGLEYAIPPTNPFRNVSGARGEIFARGFRQVWRFSFDRSTGEIWVGDVGQVSFEEVTVVREPGENHGWNVYEGFRPFSDRYREAEEKYIAPVVSLARRHGASVTGGYVYRGAKYPAWQGVYIFCDFASKKVWGLRARDRKLEAIREIARIDDRISSFGRDETGELYALGFDQGIVHRVVLEADFDGELVEAKAKP